MGKDLRGKELGEGLTQLKDGRYLGRYTNRYGKRKPIYGRNLREVKDKLVKAKYEDSLGKPNIIHKNVTVQDVYQQWIKEKEREVRKKTIYEYKKQYRLRISKYGCYKVTSINYDFVIDFMDKLISEGLSLTTIMSYKSIFSRVIEYAVEKKICLHNPFNNYKYPKTVKDEDKKKEKQRRETKYLNERQRKYFFDYINKSRQCQLRNLYKFLLHTGLRISEAIALKWEHVDFEKKAIFVQDGYTDFRDEGILYRKYDTLTKTPTSTRHIPINDAALDILIVEREKCGDNPTGLIFLNTKKQPLTYNNVRSSLMLLVERINNKLTEDKLPKVTTHYFRHTFATMCLESGVNPKAVQFYMGHANITVTMDLYSHMTEDLAFDEIKKMTQVV